MSFTVAVVAEDYTLDQFILKPVIVSLCGFLGKPRARVDMVRDPRLHGYADLFSEACGILARYGAVADLVVFVVDADCQDGTGGRSDRLASLKRVLANCPRHQDKAVAVAALQEVEVWALWGIRDQLDSAWQAVRAECHPKEAFFEAQVHQAERRTPDRGRTRLTKMSLAGGWQSIRQGCGELQVLEAELASKLALLSAS
jgi:hypothetical protein